jgi:PAS domain S-box-containing protein
MKTPLDTKNIPSPPWFIERRNLALIILAVFLFLSGTAFFLGYEYQRNALEEALKEDRTTANLISIILQEHLQRIVKTMESFASRPLLLQAVKAKNAETAREHLISLTKSNPGIGSVLITDIQGTLWVVYPEFPEVLGKNFSYRDWYEGVIKDRNPFISDAYMRVVGERDLAINISVPFFDERGDMIGILANTQRMVTLSQIIQWVPLDPGIFINITDRKGNLVFSSQYAYEKQITPYPFYSVIGHSNALDNKSVAVEDPFLGGRKSYVSFAPVAGIGWRVVVGRDSRAIFLSESAYYIQITAISILLFLLITSFLLYFRKGVATQQLMDQLQAARKVSASEERYKSYIDITMQLGWTTNDIGEIVEDNPSWSEYTGRGYEEIKGFGWLEDIHPDDRDHTEQKWRKAVAERNFYETTYRLRRYDGVYRDYLARGIPLLDENGSIREWVGTCIGITERKKAEEALAIQARIAAIFLTIPDDEMYNEVLNVILDVVRSPCGVFGYLDEAGALAVPTMTRQIWDKCQVPDKTFVFPRATWGDSSWPRAIREKKANYSNEVSTQAPGGHVPVTRHISLPILVQDEVIGLFQVANRATDYTEADIRTLETIAAQVAPLLSARLQRERAQAALDKLNAELEQRVIERTGQLDAANKEMEAFAYSVSHDLRAPLRAVDGFVHILLDDFGPRLDDEGKRICSVISESARSMGKLIDDLLALSRIGRAAMQFSPVDMEGLANSIFHELTTPENRERIDFNVGLLPPAPGDPSLLRQVWMNLLGNAVKFSSKKKRAVIEVRAEQQGAEVVYSIRDNGAGFDMRYADKLFGVFQRLHSTKNFEGTGVGLAIVQRIILRHGGRVWVEGETDKGATFYFSMKRGE